jgi:hypothetical protein
LYDGEADPGAARLEAKALAQALSATLCGFALDIEGEIAAIAAAMRVRFRSCMVVFLDAQNTNTPATP